MAARRSCSKRAASCGLPPNDRQERLAVLEGAVLDGIIRNDRATMAKLEDEDAEPSIGRIASDDSIPTHDQNYGLIRVPSDICRSACPHMLAPGQDLVQECPFFGRWQRLHRTDFPVFAILRVDFIETDSFALISVEDVEGGMSWTEGGA